MEYLRGKKLASNEDSSIRDRNTAAAPEEEESLEKGGRFSLFPLKSSAVNEEYEAEKKAEQEKFEKKFTMYLSSQGTSSTEQKSTVPWYASKLEPSEDMEDKKSKKQ